MLVQNLRSKVVALVAFTAFTAVLFAYWWTQAGGRIVPGDSYAVTAVLPNAVRLVPNADVRQAGVRIGHVTRVAGRGRGQVAVRFELEDRYAPLRRDARVLVRMRTLLGENYLDVQPGTAASPAMPDGGTLPSSAATPTVQLDDILATLDRRTRTAVRGNLRGLGGGLDERGADLNRLVGALRPTAEAGATVLAVLDRQRAALRRIVGSAADVLQAIGDRDDETAALAKLIRTTAVALARRDREIDGTVRELAPTLRQVHSTARELDGTVRTAAPVVADLRRASRHLPRLLDDLPPAARSGRALLDEVAPLARAADPLLRTVAPTSRAAVPLLGSVIDVLRQVNPVVRYLRPYAPDLAAFLGGVSTANAVSDPIGHLARIFPAVWQGVVTLVPDASRKLLQEALDALGIGDVYGEQRNAYPAPDTLAHRQQLVAVPPPPSADG